MIGFAYLMSSSRGDIKWRTVLWGFGLQFVFALIILKSPQGRLFFSGVNDVVVGFLASAQAGATFLFGNLTGMTIPVEDAAGNVTGSVARNASIFAFGVLPTIIFFASFMAVMYHLGIMQRIICSVAWVMRKTMGTSGAESMSAASNVFVGQTEAPLVVEPYIQKMTRSELMAVMTGGFATVAGAVMVAFVGFLGNKIPDFAGHLLAASIMSAPAALAMAKLFVPETAVSETIDGVHDFTQEKTDANVIDAAVRGASEGLRLSLNVVAMIVAFLGLIAFVNICLGYLGSKFGMPELNLTYILGSVFQYFTWMLGVSFAEADKMGHLIGTKLIANEFVAYLELERFINEGVISDRAATIATYALCGFANVGSIGIQIGALSAIAPKRRHDLASIGPKALVAGAFASFSTACIAGLLL